MADLQANEFISLPKEKDRDKDNSIRLASGYAMADSAKVSIKEAGIKFAKPETYTGNRALYDSGTAKRDIKLKTFENGNKVIDPYTGEELVLTIKEAKAMYGNDWDKHLAESDHIKPLEDIYNETKGKKWNSTDDIKKAANSEDNLHEVSRKFNNAKRSRKQENLVNDGKYLKEKGVELTKQGKEQAIQDARAAEKSIDKQLKKSAISNIVETGHKAGMQAGINAGGTAVTMSGIRNIIAVIEGEKDVKDALKDTVSDGGKAAVSGYVLGNALTVIGHSLSDSSSKILQTFVNSNVPGKVITAIQVTGGAIKSYANGEISVGECIKEIGKNGINLVTMSYYMGLGSMMIPIPVVGAAVGGLIGSVVTSKYYQSLVDILSTNELEHQERLKIIEESRQIAEEAIRYRVELEQNLEYYFKEYKKCFDEAFLNMKISFQMNDAGGVIAGANQITRKLGGTAYYETVDEFRSFLRDTTRIDEF